MTERIILREIPTACGRRFGHATLNSPGTLNALSLEMIDLLAPQLDRWAADPGIVGVVLDGAGEKAFCAGGDVRSLFFAIRDALAADEPAVPEVVPAFFEREYRLDYRIHTYPKPLLCWGHGIVMGGGIGLMAGASHRVVTPQTKMAMPEISIGLYPDVGGSWFLGRMPGRTGLFLALTGASINAADARFAGLADFVLDNADKERVLAAFGQTRWSSVATENHACLSRLLEESNSCGEGEASLLRKHFERIDAVIGHDGLTAIASRLLTLADAPEPWLASAAKTFSRGAPSSAVLSYALWQRTKHLSLADVLRLEYQVSVAATMQPDFSEGVRALLVDKDRNPRWQHACVADVSAADVEALFEPRFAGVHPLADLG